MRRTALVASLLLAGWAHPGVLSGSQDPPSWGSGCRISSEEVVVLGDDDDGIVGPEAVIARVGDSYYLSDQVTLSRLLVFDEQGEFEGSIGRHGEGPGEFGTIVDVVTDSLGRLWVVDGPLSRITVLEVDGAAGHVYEETDAGTRLRLYRWSLRPRTEPPRS